MSRVNITEALPLAHAQRIETRARRRGSRRTTTSSPATTRTRAIRYQVGAIDIETLRTRSIPRSSSTPQYIEAMKRTRNGAPRRRGPRRGSAAGRSATGSRSARASGRRKDGAAELGLRDRRHLSLAVGQGADERASGSTTTTSTRRAQFGNGTVTLYFVKIDDAEPRRGDLGAASTRCSPTRRTRRRRRARRIGCARRSTRSATSASSSTRSSPP